MRIGLFVIIFLSTINKSYAQTDSTAYETQRQKINALLVQRSSKFGQYDASLSSRTGIFGVQTKKDIKNSNEILRQIVLTDNNIFKELKVLLDYKNLEVEQVQSTINSTSDRIESYKKSIKKLQDQNQKLDRELKSQKEAMKFTAFLVFFVLAIVLSVVYFLSKKFKIAKR